MENYSSIKYNTMSIFKKILKCVVLIGLIQSYSFAHSGRLFNLEGSGTTISPISATLCLNGVGGISCQNYTLQALGAIISTTIQDKTYVQAGIRLNTDAYSIASGCQKISNGYCIFTVSDSKPTLIVITNYILNIKPSALTSYATVDYAYTSPLISASGGTAPYSYTVSPRLPAGVSASISSQGVVISGTPIRAGTYTFEVTATDASQAIGVQIYTLTVSKPLSFTPSFLQQGFQNQSYSETITPSGGTAPYTIQLSSGTLPTGLSFSATTNDALISGTIASTGALGSHPLTVTAVDANNVQGSIDYNLLVGTTLSLSYSQSPTSSQSTAYIILANNLVSNTVTFTASGGTGTYSYSLIPTSPATGIPGATFVGSTGVLTIPINTATGSYRFIIQAQTTNGDIGYHFYDLYVYTTPTITSVYPASGPTTGGNTVTITGTSFNAYNSPTVTFGSTPATNVVVESDTTIRCTAPAGSGTVDISIENPSAPTFLVTQSNAYTYQQPSASIDLSSYANMWGIFNNPTNYGGYSKGLDEQYFSFFPSNGGSNGISTSYQYLGQTMTILPSASGQSSAYNVIKAQGQTIAFGSSAGSYSRVYLLQTGTGIVNTSTISVTFILNYSDGTSSPYSVCLTDWGYNNCNQTVVGYSYGRGYCKGNGCTYSIKDSNMMWNIYGVTIPVDPSKTLESIQLPDASYSFYYRLFSLNLGP
jgi:IPT/TIG domain/Putative Ig domain